MSFTVLYAGMCRVCYDASFQDEQKVSDALKHCAEKSNMVESLKRIKGQLESTSRQADRAAREIEEFLDTQT